MSTVYISQSMNGRVVNTCNLSEDRGCYSIRYGDSVGDLVLRSNLTVTEVTNWSSLGNCQMFLLTKCLSVSEAAHENEPRLRCSLLSR